MGRHEAKSPPTEAERKALASVIEALAPLDTSGVKRVLSSAEAFYDDGRGPTRSVGA